MQHDESEEQGEKGARFEFRVVMGNLNQIEGHLNQWGGQGFYAAAMYMGHLGQPVVLMQRLRRA